MVLARGLRGLGRVPRRGLFHGLHHGQGSSTLTILVVVLIVVVVVLLVRGRR
ncbi:MAG: hypothetical protein QM747_19295 [Nocardioides sp.]